MTSIQAYRVPAGKMALCIVLALLIGALLPFITVLEVTTLSPVILVGGVFAVFLRCYAGWIPAILFMGVGLASMAVFLGTTMMWMTLTAAVLPALFTSFGVLRKRPFFEQLRNAVALYVTGLVAAILIAYMGFGGGMVAQLMDQIRVQFEQMPDAAFAPLVEALNSALMLNGVSGMGGITVEFYRSQMKGVLDIMEQLYGQTLPGTLMCGAVVSGVLSTLWGNWTLARRGLATNESFIGMSRWFLPPWMSLGALALWAVGYVLAASGAASGDTIYVTIYYLAGTMFTIQAISALDRRFLRAGRSTARRRTYIVLILAAALLFRGLSMVLVIYGAASALFGSQGAVRTWLNKRRDNHSNDDDLE